MAVEYHVYEDFLNGGFLVQRIDFPYEFHRFGTEEEAEAFARGGV